MSLITWNFDKNFIYVIIYWILEIIYRIGIYLKGEYFEMTKQVIIDKYIFVILDNLANLLSGFLVLYIKRSSKSKKIQSKEIIEQQPSDLIYIKSTELTKKFYIKLIIIAILDYIGKSSIWMAFAITQAIRKEVSFNLQKNITLTLDIIMRYIFSVFILKIIVYKHRKFSMITIGLGLAILIIIDIILMILNRSNYFNVAKTFFSLLLHP